MALNTFIIYAHGNSCVLNPEVLEVPDPIIENHHVRLNQLQINVQVLGDGY